jgi:hypothetical protein
MYQGSGNGWRATPLLRGAAGCCDDDSIVTGDVRTSPHIEATTGKWIHMAARAVKRSARHTVAYKTLSQNGYGQIRFRCAIVVNMPGLAKPSPALAKPSPTLAKSSGWY